MEDFGGALGSHRILDIFPKGPEKGISKRTGRAEALFWVRVQRLLEEGCETAGVHVLRLNQRTFPGFRDLAVEGVAAGI